MRLWLFGEAEYETTESFKQNSERLFDVAENCGYMIRQGKTILELQGTDLDVVSIKLHTGEKSNMLIIKSGQTTQDGSKLIAPLKQKYAGFCDPDGNNFRLIQETESL
jgi:hypothetical protein